MRTSTDILISLEEKIEKLVSYSSNQDLLLKTLNNKILKLEKKTNYATFNNRIYKRDYWLSYLTKKTE